MEKAHLDRIRERDQFDSETRYHLNMQVAGSIAIDDRHDLLAYIDELEQAGQHLADSVAPLVRHERKR
jgi:hypothetical protein